MTKPDLTSTAPKRIYLDIGDQFALESVTAGSLRWDQLEGVTWSEDNATGFGVPYVRADLVPAPAASGAAPASPAPLTEDDPDWGWLERRYAAIKTHHTHDFGDGPVLSPSCISDALREGLAQGAALASREASPAPLTSLIADLAAVVRVQNGNKHSDINELLLRAEAALASPQVAPAPVPAIWLTQKEFNVLSKAAKTERETIPLYLAAPVQVAPAPEPVAQVESWTNGSYSRNYKIKWLKNVPEGALLYLAAPVQVAPAPEPTYSSTQATKCAGCGKHKHTPLRIDAMGGYVCLTCIDQKLGSLLGEFGYPEPEAAADDARDAAIPARLTHAIQHASVAATLLMDAHLKAPETWRGWYDGALNHIDIVRGDLDVLAMRLSTPAAKPADPAEEQGS